MQYIDLHTHLFEIGPNIQILNVFAQDLPESPSDHFFSAGIHPWHIEMIDLELSIQNLESNILESNFLAIGECGLDRSISTVITEQKSIFQKQIDLAQKYSKPLIIHCVRAYPELIKMKKENRSVIHWILHAYQGNQEATLQLVKHGFYFSIGKHVLNSLKLQLALRLIPLDNLFFETDDSDYPIEKIYLFAAQILGTNVELLSQAIFTNFKIVFGDDKLVGKD